MQILSWNRLIAPHPINRIFSPNQYKYNDYSVLGEQEQFCPIFLKLPNTYYIHPKCSPKYCVWIVDFWVWAYIYTVYSGQSTRVRYNTMSIAGPAIQITVIHQLITIKSAYSNCNSSYIFIDIYVHLSKSYLLIQLIDLDSDIFIRLFKSFKGAGGGGVFITISSKSTF